MAKKSIHKKHGRALRKTSSATSISRELDSKEASCDDDGTQVERDPSQIKMKKRARSKLSRERTSEECAFDANLKEFCERAFKKGSEKITSEYMEIKQQTQAIESSRKQVCERNTERNRYKDVHCLDISRVKLTFPPDNEQDYIHANYVNCGEKGKFICTQGPMESTTPDFWRMVWQEKVRSIVMLCSVMENGKKKCEQYFPAKKGETIDSGILKISNMGSKQIEAEIHQTALQVANGTETLDVEHIHWTSWPDRGVPNNFLAPLRVLAKIKHLKPCVVHCSAGIGRTGTIVGLDVLYVRMTTEVPDMEKMLRELRQDRAGSIQTDVQYLYMHRVLVALADNKKLLNKHAEDYVRFLADFEVVRAKAAI